MPEETKQKDLNSFLGDTVWIVSDVKEFTVYLKPFFDLIRRGKDNSKTMILENILKEKEQLIGEDGLEVDLTIGALISVEGRTISKGFGIHIANLGPYDELSWKQYAWAKTILGVTRPGDITQTTEVLEERWLNTDGQFRQISVKETKCD